MAICPACGRENPPDASFCNACGTALAEPPAPGPEERKLVTVLFADLVGSTALGGSQDPERTRVTLDRFYDAMAGEVERAGGTVEKFAGDAVMAVFGAPAAVEDHAERSLHTALAMNRRLAALFGEALALRIGVETGDVVVGRPREGSSFVTGDSVNVAARLEQAAEPGEILVGERAAAIVRGAFELGPARRVEAKGKPDGIVAAPVVGALTLMRPRGVGGLNPAFVGRELELELLLATYARVVDQHAPHLVTIMADPGVGKTRLVRELWGRLSGASPEPLRRTGRCLAYGHGITYWPLGEILKEHLGILESDPSEVVQERLRPREILGLALGLDAARDLHPLTARDQLHDAWVDLLDELTSERPLVLLVEDLHWAEEPLLYLLERLMRDVGGPLFVIGTARPELIESRPTWGVGLRNVSQLWLEPLGAEQTAELTEALLASRLPPSLTAAVVERAEGNPFFVEELIATLIDRGVIGRGEHGWEVRDEAGEVELPDTVHAVVAARMDLLPATEKAGLQAASVAGRIFWRGPVVELLDGAEPDFELLESRDFVRRRSGSSLEGEQEYAIKHAVTREVAYGTLPKARRAHLHAAFAAWLERVGGGRDEHAALLAHHYGQAVDEEAADLAWAGEPDELARLQGRASTWLARAGTLAVGRFDLDEGITLLRRAAELEPDTTRRAELWRELGRANALGFHGTQFWEAMERSLALSSDDAVKGATYAELVFQTAIRIGMWPISPDRTLVSSWIGEALTLTRAGTAARAKALMAKVYWSDEPEIQAADEAIAIGEALDDPDLRVDALAMRSVAAYHDANYEDALAWSQRALRLADRLEDPERLIDLYEAVVPAQATLGRFEQARSAARLHAAAAEKLTPHHRLHGVALTSELEEVAGGWSTLRELTPEVERAVADNLATPCIRNYRTLLLCATASHLFGDHGEGERLEAVAEPITPAGHDRVLSGARLQLALARNDLDALERLVPREQEGIKRSWWYLPAETARLDALARLGDRERIEEETEPLLRLEGTLLEAFALRALGQVRGDRELVRQALERFAAMRLDWHAEQTRALL